MKRLCIILALLTLPAQVWAQANIRATQKGAELISKTTAAEMQSVLGIVGTNVATLSAAEGYAGSISDLAASEKVRVFDGADSKVITWQNQFHSISNLSGTFDLGGGVSANDVLRISGYASAAGSNQWFDLSMEDFGVSANNATMSTPNGNMRLEVLNPGSHLGINLGASTAYSEFVFRDDADLYFQIRGSGYDFATNPTNTLTITKTATAADIDCGNSFLSFSGSDQFRFDGRSDPFLALYEGGTQRGYLQAQDAINGGALRFANKMSVRGYTYFQNSAGDTLLEFDTNTFHTLAPLDTPTLTLTSTDVPTLVSSNANGEVRIKSPAASPFLSIYSDTTALAWIQPNTVTGKLRIQSELDETTIEAADSTVLVAVTKTNGVTFNGPVILKPTAAAPYIAPASPNIGLWNSNGVLYAVTDTATNALW